MTAAGTFLALLVGRAASFLAFLRAAVALVQQMVGVEAGLGKKSLMFGVGHIELGCGPAGGHRLGLGRLAVLVRVALFHAALAFRRLGIGSRYGVWAEQRVQLERARRICLLTKRNRSDKRCTDGN